MIYVDVASMNHKMCGSEFVGRVNKDTRKKGPSRGDWNYIQKKIVNTSYLPEDQLEYCCDATAGCQCSADENHE